jgi:hypothetical protein
MLWSLEVTMATRIMQDYWYLALQDGRYDDRTFLTEREAREALRRLPRFTRRGVCVMSGQRQIAAVDLIPGHTYTAIVDD